MSETTQPAVDAAQEINRLSERLNSDGTYTGISADEAAAIIARHYAPLVSLREDQMQALGLPDDDHTVIADEIRRIRDEGRAHFHDVTRLVERVKELEKALTKERAIMSYVLEGGGEELTLPEAVIACELRSKQAESKLIALRSRVAELNSKYASAEADGNSLREEREKLIARVAELEKDRERLSRLAHYFHRNNGHPNCGSEVDRLKGIIDNLDQGRTTALKERNDARRHWADTQSIAANLRLKVAELEKDRERLDLLRAGCTLWKLTDTGGTWKLWELSTNTGTYDGYTLDEAIDAARAKEDAT